MKMRVGLGLTCIAVLATAAASSPAIAEDRDRTVTPTLDAKVGTIVLPVDEFRLTADQEAIVLTARHVIVNRCLMATGKEPLPERDNRATENRRYGLWSIDHARQFGLGIPAHPESSYGPERNSEINACVMAESESLESVTPSEWYGAAQVSSDIESRALVKAIADPEWIEVSTDFNDCLLANALTPVNEPSDLALHSAEGVALIVSTPEPAHGSPRAIAIATTEATCNQAVSGTARRASIEAQYQAPLIAQSLDALQAERVAREAVINRARAAIG